VVVLAFAIEQFLGNRPGDSERAVPDGLAARRREISVTARWASAADGRPSISRAQQRDLGAVQLLYARCPSEPPFLAWLRVARNGAFDHLRQRHPLPCEEAFDRNAPTEGCLAERSSYLQEALPGLRAHQRSGEVFDHMVGLFPPEIALQLGQTEASVHGHRTRARAPRCGAPADLDCRPSVLA
jgi:hypothetical protein